MKIAVASFSHETLTFCPERSTLEAWEAGGIKYGAEALNTEGEGKTYITGYKAAAEGQENVGYVARLMKNFDLNNLILVSPKCKVGLKARSRSMHGWNILKKAKKLDSFDKAIEKYDVVIGTTAKVHSDNSTARAYMTPRELAKNIPKKSKACIVFGRESRGLTTAELKKCDIAVHIPASKYSTLSISHAAAILFYELFSTKSNVSRVESKSEKEHLVKQFSGLAKSKPAKMRNPENTVKMFRNVMSRAFISGREAHGIAGVFGNILAHISKKK